MAPKSKAAHVGQYSWTDQVIHKSYNNLPSNRHHDGGATALGLAGVGHPHGGRGELHQWVGCRSAQGKAGSWAGGQGGRLHSGQGRDHSGYIRILSNNFHLFPSVIYRHQLLPLFLPPCETAEHWATCGGKGGTWTGVNILLLKRNDWAMTGTYLERGEYLSKTMKLIFIYSCDHWSGQQF